MIRAQTRAGLAACSWRSGGKEGEETPALRPSKPASKLRPNKAEIDPRSRHWRRDFRPFSRYLPARRQRSADGGEERANPGGAALWLMTAEKEDWRAKRAPNGSVGQRSRHSGDQRKPQIRSGDRDTARQRSPPRCVFACCWDHYCRRLRAPAHINGVQTWPASTSST